MMHCACCMEPKRDMVVGEKKWVSAFALACETFCIPLRNFPFTLKTFWALCERTQKFLAECKSFCEGTQRFSEIAKHLRESTKGGSIGALYICDVIWIQIHQGLMESSEYETRATLRWAPGTIGLGSQQMCPVWKPLRLKRNPWKLNQI